MTWFFLADDVTIYPCAFGHMEGFFFFFALFYYQESIMKDKKASQWTLT